jgi:2,4-dienoyl-CoA reductase (NADPH2)
LHAEGGKIALQILHAGRYGYTPISVGPSRVKSPITPFTPRELSAGGIERQIRCFVRAGVLAREGGYDGVEVMGSEGYFINEFLAARTNKRTDAWADRSRTACACRWRSCAAPARPWAATSSSSTASRCSTSCPTARAGRGRDAGEGDRGRGRHDHQHRIGWHEARVPTIATSVPRGAFAWVTRKLKGEVSIPLVTTNRINTPEVAEQDHRPGAAPTWCRWRARCSPTRVRQQGARRPRRGHQHLHRLQPGVPRPRLPAQARLVPREPARLPRDRASTT